MARLLRNGLPAGALIDWLAGADGGAAAGALGLQWVWPMRYGPSLFFGGKAMLKMDCAAAPLSVLLLRAAKSSLATSL